MVAFGSSHKGAENDIALRNGMFSDAAKRLWSHKPSGAFVTIPKTMPFIVRILDEITKGAPVGTVYSTLWTFTWTNDAFIKMGGREKQIAYACRFTGTRGIRTLNDRLVKLRELGMIETASGDAGEISFIFLPNPHYCLYKLWLEKTVKIQTESFNAFMNRATNQGAKDFIGMMKHVEAGGVLTPFPVAPPPPPAPIFPTTPPPPPPMPGAPAAAPPPPPAPSTDFSPDELQKLIDGLRPAKPPAE